jgi:hypothetical protein
VDLVTLATERDADQEAWQRKYGGKLIEVSGMVQTADTNNVLEAPMIVLGSSKGIEAKTIHCQFTANAEDRVNELAKGQNVKVRGTLDQVGLMLHGSQFVETGPSSAVKATVDQLVADYKASQPEAEKKYHKKPILVEAAVADVKWDKGKEDVTFVLEGKSGTKMEAHHERLINEKLRPKLQAIKKGDHVRLIGEGAAFPNDKIHLNYCKLLK